MCPFLCENLSKFFTRYYLKSTTNPLAKRCEIAKHIANFQMTLNIKNTTLQVLRSNGSEFATDKNLLVARSSDLQYKNHYSTRRPPESGIETET